MALYSTAMANDVQVSNTSLSGQNTITKTTQVNFDIAWKNSWRTSTNESNYDGCWIFVKFRKQSTSVWLHATLATTGQVTPTGSTLQVSNDNKGAWVYRNANGIGDVNYTAAQLRWNYGTDGVADNDNVEIRVYAVEVVNVPQGSYNLGNASAETYKFRDGAIDTWYPVTSEAPITCGTAAGNLFASSDFLNSATIPATYPKGFAAFWCMKYEYSRQQYVDFMNTLTQTNADARNVISATGTVPNMVVTTPERAANGFTTPNAMAWLDWAAMRPMTELEYEKACRGAGITPMSLEYAWGNTTISPVVTPSNTGANNETWATGNASYNVSVVIIRCGALATASSTRTSSGATYYGIMEMSGNLYEPCVYAGDALSRAFNGLHGDGLLNATADANTPNWPVASGGPTILWRGGSYQNGTTPLQLSNRGYSSVAFGVNSASFGGRGVRTAE